MLGVVEKLGGKMVLWSAQISEYVKVRTYDAVKLERGEKSQAVRSYADVTREDVNTPLGKNRLIIP